MVILDIGTVKYWQTYKLQEELVQRKIAGDENDYLIFVEHPPVYTTGRGGNKANLPWGSIPVFRTNRGGDVTYLGPGQIVCYPIIDLRRHGSDLHLYIRQLEKAIIDTLAHFDLSVETRSGLTGVWVEDRKIAAIGIGVRKWVSMHGLALNVSCDLSYFNRIVPCGVKNIKVTSMEQELKAKMSLAEVKDKLESSLRNILTGLKSEHLAERST